MLNCSKKKKKDAGTTLQSYLDCFFSNFDSTQRPNCNIIHKSGIQWFYLKPFLNVFIFLNSNSDSQTEYACLGFWWLIFLNSQITLLTKYKTTYFSFTKNTKTPFSFTGPFGQNETFFTEKVTLNYFFSNLRVTFKM